MSVFALIRVLAFVFALLAKADPIPDQPFAPTGSSFGRDSSVMARQVSLAPDLPAFQKLWGEHRGSTGSRLPSNVQIADDFPKVDFSQNVVLMIFGGTTEAVEGYEVASTSIEGKLAVVRFSAVPPALPNNNAVSQVTQPYGLVVLPRTRFAIEVQFGSERDGWRTVAKFPATHEGPFSPKKG